MRSRTIRLGRILVYVAGFITLAVSTFWLPWQVGETARLNPSFAYLQYPILLCIYLTLFPFLYALYHADRLLDCAQKEKAGLKCLNRSLERIGYAILTVALIYIGTWILLKSAGIPVPKEIQQSVVHPLYGALILSGTIGFVRRLLQRKLEEESSSGNLK